jgi:cation diffusion facilitator CzcD-associated flavoprotein CzcO
MNVAIVGSGFGGIGMAVFLKRAGIPFVVLEKAASLGGTWRDNTYPGAACDVPSYLYSFSFAPRTNWPRAFAAQADILAYLEAVARTFGVTPHIRFGREVREAAFDEDRGLWRLACSSGETYEATVLVSACGLLNRPALPAIPGLDGFPGACFHSAAWPREADLTGRVAVIGTGASAIQIVPEIAAGARRVYVFQRSAPYVIPKPDRAHSARERDALRRFPRLRRLTRAALYAKYEARAIAFVGATAAMRLYEADFRRRLQRIVPNARLRAALVPDYAMGCKRVLLSNDYYAALGRDNVSLVTAPIERVSGNAILTVDGAERRVDTIVLATGFTATEFLAPMTVRGRDGRDLRDAWRDGAEAYLGISVAGFPNLFLLYGPNTNLGHSSIVYMLESQIRYVARTLRAMRTLRLRSVDVLPHVQRAFNGRLQRAMARTVWARGCESWYKTASGKGTINWPGFTFAYRYLTRRFDPARYRVDSYAD